ncbi:MAG: hypothetical protein V7L04_32915 [Nostoc sp.]
MLSHIPDKVVGYIIFGFRLYTLKTIAKVNFGIFGVRGIFFPTHPQAP